MSGFDFLLIIAVAAGAFYAGYKLGRASVLEEEHAPRSLPHDDAEPQSQSRFDPLPGPSEFPSRPRAAPPAASAGDADSGSARPAPRRSTPPPPARAGLLDEGHSAPKSKDPKN